MTIPRLRFAPSPTGYLHIGGARTALFNWLWARKTGGVFVLRIEDTDTQRNSRESVDAIFTAMRWLGLDWDEGPQDGDDLGGGPHGPYFQSKRLELYRQFADRLIASGHAYRCYATKEEIDAQRMALPEKQRDGFRFVSPWREKTAELDRPHVVRFKTPTTGEVVIDDMVFGAIKTAVSTVQDFILIRENALPLYNFGCVVDDITMGITHVARGRDHIINTTPQILLYQALGEAIPAMAHLPMMMATKSEKLSKRHGAVSVTEYRDQGYLPDGLLSYLVRFGWAHGDDELFRKERLIELFDWSKVSKSDGVYDFKKCRAINQKFLAKMTTDDELRLGVVPFLRARGLAVRDDHPRLADAIRTVRERSETLVAMADALDYYFRAKPEMDEAAAQKFFTAESAVPLQNLSEFAEANVRDRADFEGGFLEEHTRLDALFRAFVAERGLEMKALGQPARVALTGRTASPDLASVMLVLGPAVSALRLREAAERAAASPSATTDGPTTP
ncbi:MAG: glutamate--tRNA ligase [Deltaproteobacteria bacterium]|nr:glutamate--tRNA ligase [Deltaproteobacteria bacterium]